MNKKIIGLLSLILIGGLFLAPVVLAAETAGSGTSTGNTDTAPAAGGDIVVTPQAPPVYDADKALKILPTVINYIFGFLLVIVVVMILIAGYMFVTGGGNPETIGKARNMLMYALIGLAIAVVARGLISLVGKLLDSTITV
jgi:hypothetical protein